MPANSGSGEEEALEIAGDVFLFSPSCLAPEEEILRKALLSLCSFRQEPTHRRCRRERIELPKSKKYFLIRCELILLFFPKGL